MRGDTAPTRTCAACGRRRPKSEMLRVCRSSDGCVGLDPLGNIPGRGCYVCLETACVEDGRLKDRLAHGLRTDIPPAVLEELDSSWRRIQRTRTAGGRAQVGNYF